MINDQELKELVDESKDHWDRPFVTATEVAEHVGVSRQTIHRRLDRLHKEGEIRKYKPGRGAIWWVESEQPAQELISQ